jgi:hypothetical protein
MRYLNTSSDLSWLCAGDFNEVLEAHEQFGGQQRPERQMDGFRDAVQAVVSWIWASLVYPILGITGSRM